MDKKLKVLWFTNTVVRPESVQSNLNDDSRGWLSSLTSQIYEDVDLHIAFVHPGREMPESDLFRTHYIRPNFFKLRMILRWGLGIFDLEGNLLPQMLKIIDEVQPDLIHIHGSEKQFIELIPHLKQKQSVVLVSLQGIMSVIAKKFTAAYSKNFIRTFFYSTGFSKATFLPRTLSLDLKNVIKRADREEKYLKYTNYFAGRTFWDHSIARLFNPESTYFHIDRILKPIYYKHCWHPVKDKSETYSIHTTLSNSVYKGLDVIAEAAYLLEQSNFKFNWFVAGVDEKCWSVKAARKKLGKRYPKASLQLLGKLDANRLVANMLKCDLYVTASYIENSPNNLAEAMLLGMPCIATDVGGTSTYLENNQTGRLIPPGDPYALAGCVRLLAADPITRQKLGKHAREVSQRRHDPDRIKTSLISAYQTMLADYRRTQTRE